MAERTGLDPGLVRRYCQAACLGGNPDLLSDEDVQALGAMGFALQAGLPEEALLQIIRVYADTMSRVGEAEAKIFHFYVHERLRAEGLLGDELMEHTHAASDQVVSLVEPALLYFHRKGLAAAMREDLVLHVAEDSGASTPSEVTGQLSVAVVFVDLARFTSLTEAMGDVTATEVLGRFSDLVRGAAGECGGRVVKQIGDAFMLVFTDPALAIRCAVDMRNRSVAEPQFLGTRIGAHWGPVLYREGDYFGATVNLAARIGAEATPEQILVSGELRRSIGDDVAVFAPLGRRALKGLAEEVELFEIQHEDAEPHLRRTDPVCGMTLAPSEVVATLELASKERVFCSQECLRRFAESPATYV